MLEILVKVKNGVVIFQIPHGNGSKLLNIMPEIVCFLLFSFFFTGICLIFVRLVFRPKNYPRTSKLSTSSSESPPHTLEYSPELVRIPKTKKILSNSPPLDPWIYQSALQDVGVFESSGPESLGDVESRIIASVYQPLQTVAVAENVVEGMRACF